jgi:uncharacterized protein (TIGR03382 family)
VVTSRLLALVVLAPAAAFAHVNGINGYSGSNSGIICNSCHTGGAAPTVVLSGPATLMTSSSATYTLTITGGAGMVAGLDVSQSGGATLMAGTGTQLMAGEITHSAPAMFTGGTASFSFTVSAPASPGTLTLFAAGLSANGDNAEAGDKAAATTLTISVAPGTMTADAGMTPAPTPTPSGPTPTTTPSQRRQEALDGLVDGGCSATAALPQLALLLGVLLRRRRA